VIQPLVENAVQHGISDLKRGGTVEISVCEEEGSVVITVADDGVGMEESVRQGLFEGQSDRSSGVALKNIQRRLLSLYGQGLEIRSKVDGGTSVTLRIMK
jgi:Predicted signal transduction protein with a C-terminal ATPase domain